MNQRGRPKKDSVRTTVRGNRYEIRLSDEELDMLNQISEGTGEERSDILRKALKSSYNLYRCRVERDSW